MVYQLVARAVMLVCFAFCLVLCVTCGCASPVCHLVLGERVSGSVCGVRLGTRSRPTLLKCQLPMVDFCSVQCWWELESDLPTRVLLGFVSCSRHIICLTFRAWGYYYHFCSYSRRAAVPCLYLSLLFAFIRRGLGCFWTLC